MSIFPYCRVGRAGLHSFDADIKASLLSAQQEQTIKNRSYSRISPVPVFLLSSNLDKHKQLLSHDKSWEWIQNSSTQWLGLGDTLRAPPGIPPSQVPLGNNALGRNNTPWANSDTWFWPAYGVFATCDNSVRDRVPLHDRPGSAPSKNCVCSFSGHEIWLPNAAVKDH